MSICPGPPGGGDSTGSARASHSGLSTLSRRETPSSEPREPGFRGSFLAFDLLWRSASSAGDLLACRPRRATKIPSCREQLHRGCGRPPRYPSKRKNPLPPPHQDRVPDRLGHWTRQPGSGLHFLGAWPHRPSPVGHAPRSAPFSDVRSRPGPAPRPPSAA